MTPNDQDRERELFRFLMQNIPDRVYFKDRDSRFICVNAAMAQLFHLKGPEDAVGKIDSDFFPKEDAQRMLEDEQRVFRTGEPILGKVEKKLLPDGTTGWTLTTKLPLRRPDGEIIGTCGISKDITPLMTAEAALETERNRLREANASLARSQALLERNLGELRDAQARLIAAEKAQTVGRLAVGIAHEVKNPLAIINMGVDFFSTQTNGDENSKLVLKEMADAVRRADAIIGELMVFSDAGELKLSPIQLSELVDSAIGSLAERLSEAKIRVVKDYGKDLPALRVEGDKIQKVFASLVQNALDAMHGGGTLTVRLALTQIVPPGAARDRGGRSLAESGVRRIGIVAEFEDTGCGIAPEKLGGIFDAFYTTKATGHGTGLGLTVSRKVVELHGGTLEISNRPGGGVSARVVLKV